MVARIGWRRKTRIGQVPLAFGHMHSEAIGPRGTGRLADYPFEALLNSWGELCVQP
jgi:hypothetical protein